MVLLVNRLTNLALLDLVIFTILEFGTAEILGRMASEVEGVNMSHGINAKSNLLTNVGTSQT